LDQMPSDSEIIRFSDQLDSDMIRKLVIHLGLSVIEWENMRVNHPHNIELVKFLILIKWREKKTEIVRDLAEALTKCVSQLINYVRWVHYC
jgi:malonyl CoA-acyl carrier protein transacylase